MVKWFYDHLARLIYAEAVSWNAGHIAELREYVDNDRKGHYLDGYAGEYIMPNSTLYRREGQLYADVESNEDEVPVWRAPSVYPTLSASFAPPVLSLVESMSALGALTLAGVKAVADIWGEVDFVDTQTRAEAERLTRLLIERFIVEKLPGERASQNDVNWLYRSWQMPMYHFDFAMIDVPLDELKAQQDAMMWAEAGYHPGES